jgi:hypothetical protein
MKSFFRRAWRRGLVLFWLASGALVAEFIVIEDYGLAASLACAAVGGTFVALRKKSFPDLTVSWDHAKSISRAHPPAFEQVDSKHPLVALIVDGEQHGIYVAVYPAAQTRDWVYQMGPTAWGPTPYDTGGIVDDSLLDAGWTRHLRYLPQGDLADEIWRRNFESVGFGRRYRALPLTR